MNTSDKLFIEFAMEYRKEFDESASDGEIMDAFYRLTNVLRVLKRHALDKRFDRPVALAIIKKYSNRHENYNNAKPALLSGFLSSEENLLI